MVSLRRRVLAVDAFYRNPVFRISRTINPLGTEQATAALAELSCGCGNPGTVLADLNRSSHRRRSLYLDHVICTHAARSILLGRICFGFSKLPSPISDDHPAVAVSAKNVVGNFWF